MPEVEILMLDPITQRMICSRCWNGVHGDKHAHERCDCLCKTEVKELEPDVVLWNHNVLEIQ